MEFFLTILGLTVALGCLAMLLLNIPNTTFLGMIGAWCLLGALFSACILGLIISVYVYVEVSKATAPLIGLMLALPFGIFPAYFAFRLLGNSKRENDGRGFGDGG